MGAGLEPTGQGSVRAYGQEANVNAANAAFHAPDSS